MRGKWTLRLAFVILLLLGTSLWRTSPLFPVLGDNGGPTGVCDYAWTDSKQPPAVDFMWIDIQSSGTQITAWTVTADDGYAGPLPLGFNFSFYGTLFSDVFVGTNGYLSFGSGHSAIPNAVIPDPIPPNAFAMAYGADLNPSAVSSPAGVYYQLLTAPNRFVVAYYDVPHFPDSRPVTFEIILYESGEIWFQYLALTGVVNVVGIENEAGTSGTNYGTALSNGLAIRFQVNGLRPAPVGVFVAPCEQAVSTIRGAQVAANFTFINVGTAGNDTFELSFASPSGWNATFYQLDGVTLLPDTNANAGPDTGPVAPNGTADIVLQIDVPLTASVSEAITVTARSSTNASIASSALIHLNLPPTIASPAASIIPAIDGLLSPGEWSDAFSVDLSTIPLNIVPGFLLAKNDFEFLYIAYDATGDVTESRLDVASIAFDTDDDDLATDGREDQFIHGGLVGSERAHLIYSANFTAWILEDSPYNPDLPNHLGLQSAWGFGPSDLGSDDHRVYEFAVPLALLGVAPGESLGFFGGSQPVPGLFDHSVSRWSTWPVWSAGALPLPSFGILILAPAVPPDHDVAATDLKIRAFLRPGDTTPVDATIRNRGLNNEMDILVNFTVEGVLQDSSNLTFLQNGSLDLVSFSWTAPTTEGVYRIGIQVATVPNEDITGNNEIYEDVVVLRGPSMGRLALISDGQELGIITALLDGLGLDYDVFDNNDFLGHTGDLGLLLQYEAIVYSTNFGMSNPEHDALEGYIQLGGKLAVTGFDSLIFTSPLAALVRTSSAGDGPFLPSFTVTDGSHPIMNGAFGFFPTGTALDAVVPDHDRVEADTSRGARTIAELTDGADKIIVTEMASGGIVTFWNGVGPQDWAGNVRLEIMFKNLLDWYMAGPADVVPPTMIITSPFSGAVIDTRTVLVNWATSDAGSGIAHIEVSLDAGVPEILPSHAVDHTFIEVPDGEHAITVTGFDRFGNSRAASVNLTVDSIPPTLSISFPSFEAVLAASSVEVMWTAVDQTSGIAGFVVNLDGVSVFTLEPTASRLTFTGIAEGVHTVTVTAIDLAGHAQVASVTFTLDLTAPTLSVSAPLPASILASPSVRVLFSVLDQTSGVERLEISLDGGSRVVLPATVSGHTFEGVADGVHIVHVAAIDFAGNAASVSVEFTVDTNIFSSTGPFGIILLLSVIVATVVVAGVALVLFLRRRGRPPS